MYVSQHGRTLTLNIIQFHKHYDSVMSSYHVAVLSGENIYDLRLSAQYHNQKQLSELFPKPIVLAFNGRFLGRSIRQ